MQKVIVIGSSNTDMVIKSDKLPAPGETVLGGAFFMNPGGKGANQAVASVRLGASTTFIAKIGADIFGDQATKQFLEEGLDLRFLFVDPQTPSGIALINVDKQGENCIAVASGANNNLTTHDIDVASACFEPNDVLLIQLETPIETVAYAINLAKQKGMKVILNPAPAATLPSIVFRGLFAITPNETEAEILTGVKVYDMQTAQKAANILIEQGVENVIITLGAKGAYLKTSHHDLIIEAPKVMAQDTTAAGDCFNGALAVAITENLPLPQAVEFACKAAAISVTRLGAQSSVPFRHELST